nr:immunoglobulin heavy chain junction region [Mus musculus]MBK4183960.1 immunoglobulin heavy chain junction region [Mus musculus]MBK4185881.1 immunoglobulin heavy chain junction region [Mus musculus]
CARGIYGNYPDYW